MELEKIFKEVYSVFIFVVNKMTSGSEVERGFIFKN